MGEIIEDGANFLPRLAKGRDLLCNFFKARTARWKFWYYECEAGGIDLFCDLQQHLGKARAAALLPAAVDNALRQSDLDLLATALWLLVTLAKIAGIRAVPAELRKPFAALAKKVAAPRGHRDLDFLWETAQKQFKG